MNVWRIIRTLTLVAALALVAAACSSSADETAAEDSDESSTGVDDTGSGDTSSETATDDSEASEPAPAEIDPPMVDPGPCAFDTPPGITVDCGWIDVPEHWDDPSDRDTVRLQVATFTTEDTPTDATPLVYLEGGPGGDVFGLLPLTFSDQFGPMIERHPIILFSQRGSALTDIDLECEEATDAELESWQTLPDGADSDRYLAAMAACSDRLRREGADLGAYHTVASAHDADAIRSSLGYEQWNVLGISYGTRLAQELVRQHPDGVRSVILDSIQPTDPRLGSLAAVPTTFDGALDELLAGCAANPGCASANPDLDARLRAVVERAAAEPFEFDVTDPTSLDSFVAYVDDNRLTQIIFQALYSDEAFAAVPEMITELEAGETTILSSLVGVSIAQLDLISYGMYASVMCHDYLTELTPDSAWDAGLVGDPLFDETFAGENEFEFDLLCEVFDTGSADASITDAVASDVPALLMAGRYDPITPPSFAEAVAPGFRNGQLAVLPNVGHGVVLDPCGAEIAVAFLADPDSTVDQSCIDSIPEPTWVPSSLAGIDFEEYDNPLTGVRGVFPAGWVEQIPGVSIRTDTNIAHQTVLLQQGGPVPVDTFIGLFGSQFRGEPSPTGEISAGGRTWEVFEIEGELGDGFMYFATEDAFTFAVGVFGEAEDLPDVVANVVPTVLASIERNA